MAKHVPCSSFELFELLSLSSCPPDVYNLRRLWFHSVNLPVFRGTHFDPSPCLLLIRRILRRKRRKRLLQLLLLIVRTVWLTTSLITRPNTLRQTWLPQARCPPCALSTCAARRSRWPPPLLSWRPTCQVKSGKHQESFGLDILNMFLYVFNMFWISCNM